MERLIERALFASRWLLVPIYVGLVVLLAVLVVHMFIELGYVVATAVTISETDLLLRTLTFVDYTLVAGLVIMVMLSGYENFVSRFDPETAVRTLAWLGKLDSGSLKLKLAATILAISMIHLLQAFLDAEHVADDKLLWLVVIHLSFVTSAVMLAVMDWLHAQTQDRA